MPSSRGFSLIEVVVSIFIVGVMLVLLQAVFRSSVLVRIAKNEGIALSIARNEVESLRAGGYASLPLGSTFYDSLVTSLNTNATTTLAITVYNATTKQVVVSVVWLDPSKTASSTVSLSTLITQTGGLP